MPSHIYCQLPFFACRHSRQDSECMALQLFVADDLPGFFARYPSAVVVGTIIYFGATIGVEGAYAFRWLRRKEYKIAPGRIWKGIFLANLASYAVVAPLHYYLTRPLPQSIHEFTQNADWTSNPAVRLFFTDGTNDNLKSMQLGGSARRQSFP